MKVSVNISTDYHEQKMVPQKIFPHTFKAESYVGLVPKNLNVKLLDDSLRALHLLMNLPIHLRDRFNNHLVSRHIGVITLYARSSVVAAS